MFFSHVQTRWLIIILIQEELKEILGNSVDAAQFYSILHEECMPKNKEGNGKKKVSRFNSKQ